MLYNKDKTILIACPPAKTECNIPSTVTEIANYAFAGCWNLKSLNIPELVTSIEDYAFAGCKSLKSLNITEAVTSIGDYAFKDCGSLVSIDFPASLTSIGDDIFSGCGRLKEIRVAPGNSWFADVDGVLYDQDLYELRFCPNV